MERDFIVSELRRVSQGNGGVAVGRLRFQAQAGLKEYHWLKFWPRYSDLVREAGLKPNTLEEGWSEEELCTFLAQLTRELGHFPVSGEIRVKKTADANFPNHKVFDRLGSKTEKIGRGIAFCHTNDGFDDVRRICEAAMPTSVPESRSKAPTPVDGHVYLIKSGKFYKIGYSVHAGSRERQLAIQLPEPVATVHVISTDDPPGIEAYWHQRFESKRQNGEWFALTRDDVAAFCRRKFM